MGRDRRMGQPMDETRPNRSDAAGQRWSSSRFVATLVLVPAVPMLLLSVASLGLFYMAPVRFGQLISRLPGESLIRTALVFAPATLFAIVVLAVLYAVEQPVEERVRAYPRQEARPVGDLIKGASQWLLAPAALASILSLGLWALSFVSESRFDRLLAPLPGDSYWKPLVPYFPWVLFPITLLLAYLAFTPGVKGEVPIIKDRVRRRHRSLLDTAVSAILTFALPSLLASSVALIAYRLRPEQVSSIFDRLPFDTLVRLILLFAPLTLFSVVVLAVLFLLGSKRERGLEIDSDQIEKGKPDRSTWRASLAMGVLIAGLSLSAFLGMGSLGALLYIIFR
jgi:hypothetical protein